MFCEVIIEVLMLNLVEKVLFFSVIGLKLWVCVCFFSVLKFSLVCWNICMVRLCWI